MAKSLDEIKTELAKRLDAAETLRAAWEKVERCRKKDGSDFVALAKNFKNAGVYDSQYSMVPEKEIRVFGFSKFSGYVDDSVRNRELARYSKREVSADRIKKESFLEPYFYLTVDEIFEEIAAKIAYYTRRVEILTAELKKADSVFPAFKAAIDSALDKLSAETGSTDLYYQCAEYLKGAEYGRRAV